jgi:hypothetical protein
MLYNVFALAMWLDFKNVSRRPMADEITKVEDSNRS